MDAARHRVARGFPALSVDTAPIQTTGPSKSQLIYPPDSAMLRSTHTAACHPRRPPFVCPSLRVTSHRISAQTERAALARSVLGSEEHLAVPSQACTRVINRLRRGTLTQASRRATITTSASTAAVEGPRRPASIRRSDLLPGVHAYRPRPGLTDEPASPYQNGRRPIPSRETSRRHPLPPSPPRHLSSTIFFADFCPSPFRRRK